MTAKDGDPCDGFNGDTRRDGTMLNTHLTGALYACDVCDEKMQYFTPEGSACVGYRNERKPVAGVVNCDNLRFECGRGDNAACDDLPRHGAK
jgi:hypothetical protein